MAEWLRRVTRNHMGSPAQVRVLLLSFSFFLRIRVNRTAVVVLIWAFESDEIGFGFVWTLLVDPCGGAAAGWGLVETIRVDFGEHDGGDPLPVSKRKNR